MNKIISVCDQYYNNKKKVKTQNSILIQIIGDNINCFDDIDKLRKSYTQKYTTIKL